MLTFDRAQELALFQRLANEPKFTEWLRFKLECEKDTLTKAQDIEAIRRAQGKAQLLDLMIQFLEASSRR